jgi:alpha-L-fucosidase 2
MKKVISAISALLLLINILALPAFSQNVNTSALSNTIDWQKFLGRNDMLWNKLPDNWDNAPFIGNGRLGTIFWMNKEDGALTFEVSRSDLYDHRENVYKGASTLFSNNRLPNGHFELNFNDKNPQGNMRLDLWNAEVTGKIIANGAENNIKCFTHANTDVIVIEVTGTQPVSLSWFPDSAKSTRGHGPKNYIAYPVQVLQQQGDINISVQDMPDDDLYGTRGKGEGQYATAWKAVKKGNKTTYYVSMGFSYPGTTAVSEAVDRIKKAAGTDMAAFEAAHCAWWHNYYPKSFLSVPDAAMESFYWIQIYKMASTSRQGGPIIDLMGPWFRTTVWPAIWWNLNIQLTYWPFYMSNHLEEAEPLAATVWKDRENLAKNAAPYKDSYAIGRGTAPDGRGPVGNEVGNLPWVMHNLWMYYRSSMDDHYLKEQLFPLMKGSFNYLHHIIVKQPDGSFALPNTASPEYTDAVENSSYTLACLRWLASTLITADSRLKNNDPIVPECREVLAQLVPYEVDSTGFMVGKNMEFAKSHRHWSHMFMVYPFHEYSFDNPQQAPLIQKSLNNWISRPQAFAGYSWLGAASILSSGGRGDEALGFLHSFLQKSPRPNTLYREGSPVIETPLAYDRTLQELVMTSYGDMIRIFPGLPSTWKDVSFADFRAEGAFLVSAQRRNGITQYVKVQSLAGEPCHVRTGMSGTIKAMGKTRIKDLGNGVTEVDIAKGETAVLYTGSQSPVTNASPVIQTVPASAWGYSNPVH